MTRTTLAIVPLMLWTAAATTAVVRQPPPPVRMTAITHAQLLDVKTGSIQRDVTIVIRDRTIVSVGSAAPPAGSTVVDARGRTILPGLIDAHAHISDTAAAKVALMSGVTTARSAGVPMFADVALREMVKSGYLAGPDILAAGVHLQPRFEN